MREIRTLRATWRGLETWCGSGPPGHTGAPALDPTVRRTEASARAIERASSDPTLAKRLNKGRQLPAEVVEGRASPKGNSR